MSTILTGLWRHGSGDDVARYALLLAIARQMEFHLALEYCLGSSARLRGRYV